MDPEDEAKKSSGGNPEALLHDQGVSDLSCRHLPSIQSSSPGDHSSFHSNSVNLHQVRMDVNAPDLPTRSMATGEGEEDKATPRRQNGPLNLLDLPIDVLKEILSQVRPYISPTPRSSSR